MTTELVGTDPEFLARVRESAGGCKPRAVALHDAVRAVGQPIGWHEAEAVAEALRHRYDNVYGRSRWISVGTWRDPQALAALRSNMRADLVVLVDENHSALVDEPVEWLYAEDRFAATPPTDDDRGRTPLTAAQVAALPDHFHVLVKLVGHTQRLDR